MVWLPVSQKTNLKFKIRRLYYQRFLLHESSAQHKICSFKALAKLANIAWQILLFVSESLTTDKKVKPDLRRKQ